MYLRTYVSMYVFASVLFVYASMRVYRRKQYVCVSMYTCHVMSCHGMVVVR